MGKATLLWAVGARDVDYCGDGGEGLLVEVVQELRGGFGDEEEVLDGGETEPAAATAFEEVQKGAEAAAQEAVLRPKSVVEIDYSKEFCCAGAEQSTKGIWCMSDDLSVRKDRIDQEIHASADRS